MAACSYPAKPFGPASEHTLSKPPSIRLETLSDVPFVYQGFYPTRGVVLNSGHFHFTVTPWTVVDLDTRLIRCITFPRLPPGSGRRTMDEVTAELTPAQVQEVETIHGRLLGGGPAEATRRPWVSHAVYDTIRAIDGQRVATVSDSTEFSAMPQIMVRFHQLKRAACDGRPKVSGPVPTADLRGAKLDGQSAIGFDVAEGRFDNARMARFRFDRAVLQRASLRGVVGPEASFVEAKLEGATLDGASLPGANFRGAKLIGATMRGTRLVGADFRGADLGGADLTRADIRGASFNEALFDCGTRLPRGYTPQKLGMFAADPQRRRAGERGGPGQGIKARMRDPLAACNWSHASSCVEHGGAQAACPDRARRDGDAQRDGSRRASPCGVNGASRGRHGGALRPRAGSAPIG